MNKKLVLLVALSGTILALVVFFRFGSLGTNFAWNISNGGTWLLPLIAISALVDSINPCAFSILLLTVAFLLSVGKLRSSILAIGSSYIFGIFLAYLAIGLGILQALHLFNTPHFMAKVGATLLIALGAINLINEFFPAFPVKLRIPHSAHRAMAGLMDKASFPTAFLLGGLVGLCEFPCTGGPYLMVLGLLHDQVTYLRGLGYLLLYNLIFVAPLAILLLIASDSRLLAKAQEWQKQERRGMRIGGGIAMAALGLLILFL
jgi:cytochrome c biogenesis protein CcdA